MLFYQLSTRIPRRNHITPVLRELHWLNIHDRTIFKILLLTHKAVHNTAPEYLCDLIRFSNSFFDRSFLYASPTLWNALDLYIQLLPFDAFKNESRHISI